ncbi:MAG: tetratricopeptide repeat protein [Cytophagales bacterium]
MPITNKHLLIVFLVLIANLSFGVAFDSTLIKLLEKSEKLTRSGEYQASSTTLDSALKIAQNHASDLELAQVYNNMGRNFDYMGKIEEALKIYLKALSLAEKVKDNFSIAKIYKNMGALYVAQKDLKMGLDYYNKAEFFASKTTDKKLKADIFNNKGLIFDEQGKSDLGLELYLKAYKIYKEIKNDERIGMAANNIAIVYKNKKDYNNAAKYLLESLSISERMGNVWVTAANYTNLSNIYSGQKDYQKSIAYNLQAIKMATKLNAREITTAAYHNLRDNYDSLKNYKKALEYAKIHLSEKDSLLNSERTALITEMREKYDADKKQDTIRLQTQQKLIDDLQISTQNLKMKQQNTNWGIAISALVLLLGVCWLVYNRSKMAEKALLEAELLRKEKEMQTAVYEAEKAERIRIARDMHDELGSGLSKIAILTGNVIQKAALIEGVNSDVENIAKTARNLVGNMSDLVWALNADDTTFDYLVARLREYVYDFLEDCNIDFNTNFPVEVPDIQMGKEVQRNIFLSFKEILNNTVKHAEATLINIEILLLDGKIDILISDNGKGFEIENARKHGNGLKNIKNRIQRIGGEYILKSEIGKGTISHLVLAV